MEKEEGEREEENGLVRGRGRRTGSEEEGEQEGGRKVGRWAGSENYFLSEEVGWEMALKWVSVVTGGHSEKDEICRKRSSM